MPQRVYQVVMTHEDDSSLHDIVVLRENSDEWQKYVSLGIRTSDENGRIEEASIALDTVELRDVVSMLSGVLDYRIRKGI